MDYSTKTMNNCQAGHSRHATKLVPTDVGDMVIYDWREYADFQGFCTGQDDVSKTLELYGTWDQPIKQLIEHLADENQSKGIFVDVGAHVGYFSRLAVNKGFYVMAYEAESGTADIAQHNVPTAKVTQIWFGENTVPASFPNELEVDIMKIDIEGNEQHAIRYFSQLFISRQVKNIIMEVSPVFNDSYERLLRMLEGEGFSVRQLDGQPFNWDFNFLQTNLWLHL